MDLWSEFSFFQGEQTAYKENSLFGWCHNNPIKGERILKEWDNEKNIDNNGGEITPKDVCRGSAKKVWWKCSRCGNSYQLPIRRRISYVTGCNKCRTKGTSYSEQFIFYGLQQHFPDVKSRSKISDEKIEFNIVLPSINTYIEYSGEFWHTHYSKKDDIKRAYCKNNGIRFIEIWEMQKYIPITVEGDVIRYKFNDARQDETLYQVLLKLYGLLGYSEAKIDYNEVVRKANERMYRPIENNIMETYKELEKEWDIKLNNGAKPEYFSSGSAKRIIWTCIKCHGRWSVSISSRTEFKSGCPYCGYNVFDGKVHQLGGKKKIRVLFGFNNL